MTVQKFGFASTATFLHYSSCPRVHGEFEPTLAQEGEVGDNINRCIVLV